MRTFVVALAVLAALGAGAHAAKGKGARLVLVGGAMADDHIVDAMLTEIGPHARVGIITAASSVPEKRMADLTPRFLRGGAASVVELPATADPSAVDGVDLVFMAGGSQTTLKESLMPNGRPTPMMRRLMARYASGRLVVGGTSAGSAVTPSGPIIAGGESLGAIHETPAHDLGGGLGFIHALVDTHFAERGRQVRLVRLAADLGETRAYGIDEDTALVIHDALGEDPHMRVVGQGGVSVFAVAGTTTNVRMDYLTDGDRYRPRTGRITLAPGKRRAPRATARPSDVRDALSSPFHRAKVPGDGDEQTARAGARAMVRLAHAAVSRPVTGRAWEDTEVRVRLAPGRDAAAFAHPSSRRPATLRNVRLSFGR